MQKSWKKGCPEGRFLLFLGEENAAAQENFSRKKRHGNSHAAFVSVKDYSTSKMTF